MNKSFFCTAALVLGLMMLFVSCKSECDCGPGYQFFKFVSKNNRNLIGDKPGQIPKQAVSFKLKETGENPGFGVGHSRTHSDYDTLNPIWKLTDGNYFVIQGHLDKMRDTGLKSGNGNYDLTIYADFEGINDRDTIIFRYENNIQTTVLFNAQIVERERPWRQSSLPTGIIDQGTLYFVKDRE